jgi:23S rRNA (uracil1939-C5)-methyltransferase
LLPPRYGRTPLCPRPRVPVSMNAIQLHVTGMAHGGAAVARHEGKVIFIPYALPGEEVLVELTEDKASYSRARLVEVVTASPQRVEPHCLHFGSCGGCHWQHIAYDGQLDLREQILKNQLERIGRLGRVSVRASIGQADPWHYRNNVQMHMDEGGHLGFMGTDGRRVVAIQECPVMHPLVADVFAALDVDFPELERVSIRAGSTTGQQLLILETVGDSAPAVEIDVPVACVLLLEDGTPITYVGESHITEKLGERSFRISATSFFQVNTAQTVQLLDTVRQYVAPQADDVLLDVYCGVGTIGLTLADAVRKVIGIEESEAAVADALFNSREIGNVHLLQGRAEDVLPKIENNVDTVILDPPRQGCRGEVLAALARLAPKKIVYVSCDPATLARDIRRLVRGGYQLMDVQPVDMFPQTYHVEAVVLLRLWES